MERNQLRDGVKQVLLKGAYDREELLNVVRNHVNEIVAKIQSIQEANANV